MTTLAPLQMGTLLHALPPQPQGFAAVNDDEFPALGTERKVARTVQALAEASAAAAAAKNDSDAAPGEPEEGTPKLKPRADTFDGPAL